MGKLAGSETVMEGDVNGYVLRVMMAFAIMNDAAVAWVLLYYSVLCLWLPHAYLVPSSCHYYLLTLNVCSPPGCIQTAGWYYYC